MCAKMLHASEYLENITAKNRFDFTTEEAVSEIGGSIESVRAKIRTLRQKQKIATPLRSFHVLIPSNCDRLGSAPPDNFIDQLMQHINEPYYVGLLTAATRYGAFHHVPQVFQVMVKKSRPRIMCGNIPIQFIGRRNLEKMPYNLFDSPSGKIRYATPEVTAFELVAHPLKTGGPDNIATVLIDLAEELDPVKLAEVAKLQPICWVQRLGYYLEFIEEFQLAETLLPYVSENARSYTPLVRCIGTKNFPRSKKWKLIINAEVDPD